MWFVPDPTMGVAKAQRPTIAETARQRLYFQHMELEERSAIADLFEVLEHLVLCDELPAEARGVYDRAVMQLGRNGSCRAA